MSFIDCFVSVGVYFVDTYTIKSCVEGDMNHQTRLLLLCVDTFLVFMFAIRSIWSHCCAYGTRFYMMIGCGADMEQLAGISHNVICAGVL